MVSNNAVNCIDYLGLDDIRTKGKSWWESPEAGDKIQYQDESCFFGYDYADGTYDLGTLKKDLSTVVLDPEISKLLGGVTEVDLRDLYFCGSEDSFEKFIAALRRKTSFGLSDICISCEDLKKIIDNFKEVPKILRKNAEHAKNYDQIMQGLERVGDRGLFSGSVVKKTSTQMSSILKTLENNSAFNWTPGNRRHPTLHSGNSALQKLLDGAEAEAQRMENIVSLLEQEYKARNCK
jgi:hypothetical protein